MVPIIIQMLIDARTLVRSPRLCIITIGEKVDGVAEINYVITWKHKLSVSLIETLIDAQSAPFVTPSIMSNSDVNDWHTV